MSYKILITSEFKKEIKHLSKKYSSIRSDFDLFLKQLTQDPFQGTSIGKSCYKIRLAIKSKGRGKSGGARIITYVQIISETVLLISIYDKSEVSTITDKVINKRIKNSLA